MSLWNRNALCGAFAASLLILVAGCSDDVTCPGVGDTEDDPYIAGTIVQQSGSRADETVVEVFCSADPIPDLYIVSVNDRAVPQVESPGQAGLLAVLEEDALVWQPGTRCSLRVTTDRGFATAVAVMPAPFAVSPPVEFTIGDTLKLRWRRSEGADYYWVDAMLEDGSSSPIAIAATVTETVAVFPPSAVPFVGIISGGVAAVSGPVLQSGAGGNISGAGWGFFTAAYHDESSAFAFDVSDTLAPRP